MDKHQDTRLDEDDDDDVSEIFVGSILKGHCNLLLQLEPTEGSETSSSSSAKLSHTPCVNPKIKKCHQDHGESSNTRFALCLLLLRGIPLAELFCPLSILTMMSIMDSDRSSFFSSAVCK